MAVTLLWHEGQYGERESAVRAQRSISIFCLGNSETASRRSFQDGSRHGKILAICPNYSSRFC